MSGSQRLVKDIPMSGHLAAVDLDPALPHESTGGIHASGSSDAVDVPRWKRMLDLSFVLLSLPLLLPTLLVIALLVKGSSAGPVLFKQERIGLRGRRFTLYKFRTMIAGTDCKVHEAHVESLIKGNGPMTKLDASGDKRLIPVGRVLRASGLDELPQLINVLRGEMSVVGPRPCIPAEYERYLVPQRERFNTLPGLTGLWQVSGKNRLTFTQMIDCDVEYVRTRTLGLDLWIILKTLPAVIGEIRLARRAASARNADGSHASADRNH